MRVGVGGSLLAFLLSVGCAAQLSPPQLVGDESSDLAVREFLYTGKLLAWANHLDFDYERIDKAIAPDALPVQFGMVGRQSIPYRLTVNPRYAVPEGRASDAERFAIRERFIRIGHHASQIICRNYLAGLRDRNEYFEFLQKELGFATNLTGVLLTYAHAGGRTKDTFTQIVNAANLGMDAYQGFRFLEPHIETILPLVEAAQVAMRDYYVDRAKGAPAGFAGALNAVSKIEYQCTRSGIRAILTKVLVGSDPKFTVVNGTLLPHKAEPSAPAPQKPQTPPAPNGK